MINARERKKLNSGSILLVITLLISARSAVAAIGVPSQNVSGNAVSSSSSGCTNNQIVSLTATTPIGITQQAAISSAQSDSRYQSLSANASSVSFVAIGHGWGINRTTCTVSLEGLFVNFLVTASDTSRYRIVASEDAHGVVQEIQKEAAVAASISVGNSETYSGYGVSENSAANQELIGAVTVFTQPTVSAPSGTYLGQTEPSCSPDNCQVTMWDGLASSDYDGPGSASSGGVVQGGTYATVDSSGTVNYFTWGENFRSNLSNNTISTCGGNDVPSPGDTISAYVEDEYLATGTSGSNWYTSEIDGSNDCEFTWSSVETPYYADYFVERPQIGSSSYAVLPNFDSVSFAQCQYYFTSWVDAYTPYNDGYGFGAQMLNSYGGTNYQDTTTDSMYEGQYSIGEFTVGYDDSIGT